MLSGLIGAATSLLQVAVLRTAAWTARLVVTTHDGSPMRPEVVTRAFERLTKRLGVNLRLHDLRHAYASELLSRGVSILAVSRILGHASVAFTGDRYGHLMARDFDAVRAAQLPRTRPL